MNVWNTHQAQLGTWLGGSMNGGPNADGRYPLVDALGRETLVPSPAAFSDMVHGPANIAELAKAAAELARDQAEASAVRADLQSDLAAAARGAAVEARNLAQEHRNHAGTSEANARYWAEQAQSKGEATAADRATVEQLASETADNAALAALDAQAAAASAALAATFDPNLFDKKSDTLAASRLTGMIDPARIPVLVGQTPVVSTGGIANLTAGQQSGVVAGTLVATTDGRRWVYSGSGSKTAEASYIEQGDVTPDWTVIANKPSFFPTNIINVTGLQTALDGKLSSGTAITVKHVAFNTGLLYADGNHSVIKTGVAGSEKYWRFDANGWFYALSGGIHSSTTVQAMTNIVVGDAAAGSRANLEKGWLELRNDSNGYGPYIDLSANASADYHGRIAWTGENRLHIISTTDVHLTASGGSVRAYSSNGKQGGEVLTENGFEQTTNKRIVFSGTNTEDFHSASIDHKLEVRSLNGGSAALMAFHRPGAYATFFGLGVDNQFRYGGWSTGQKSYRFWTEQNFTPANYLSALTNVWNSTVDGKERFYFAPNGRTFIRGHLGIEFRNSADTNVGSFEEDGTFWAGKGNFNGGLSINNVSPTIFLQDTNHRSAFIHVNENRFYILRGSGVNSGSWQTTGSGWPMTINLENNDVEFNGEINLRGGKWYRVEGNTGIYFASWDGGWHMTDTTWLRTLNGKSIVTGGTVQMGAFTVTSDRRLKTNIVPLAGAAEIIDATNVYEFTKAGRRQYGVIAQEAQEVAPILVSEGADLHPEDGDAILSVDLTGYIPVLIDEVKALRQRVASLEGRA